MRLRTAQQHLAHEFDRAARRYDLLQRFNPGYRKHLRWSAERLSAPARGHILDLCCGTGLSTAALVACYPHARITAVDISAGMLAAARSKAALERVRFVGGDAMDLRSCGATGPYDAVFMAYGIRNVPDPDLCLARLQELLVAGAPLAFHEYVLSGSLYASAVWNSVARAVIVPLGTLASGSASLYQYLRRSVNEFDELPQFEQRLLRAGFVDVRSECMDGWQRGIVHTVLATKR
jgi:ubiquinone/menaquinone biosynthesis C-methylase UbiE